VTRRALGRRYHRSKRHTQLVTLVERINRFAMLVKIFHKDTTTVVAALAKHIGKLPEELRRQLTRIKAKRCVPTSVSRLPPTSGSISVIRSVPGRRFKREHQRLAASVLPESDRLLT